MSYQSPVNSLRLWLSVIFTAACTADFLVSGSSMALLGVLLGVLGTAIILMNLVAGGEYRLGQYKRWPVLVAFAIATVVLVALQAPTWTFLAFAGLLLLMALVGLLRRRVS